MNERIRELIEQAHEQKPVIVLDPETCQPTHKIGNGGVPMYHRELNLEKLAELIVRECARRCEDIAIKHQVEETTYAAGKKAGAFECAKDLKQHFGVEE